MFSQNNPLVIGFGLVLKHKKYAKASSVCPFEL
jgi:hypothetical protein